MTGKKIATDCGAGEPLKTAQRAVFVFETAQIYLANLPQFYTLREVPVRQSLTRQPRIEKGAICTRIIGFGKGNGTGFAASQGTGIMMKLLASAGGAPVVLRWLFCAIFGNPAQEWLAALYRL